MAETKKAKVPTSVKEDKVTIRLPREKDSQEGVVVWVNEKRYLIKRGVPVEVPESVALIIEAQEEMLEYIYEFEDKLDKKQKR